MLVLFDHGTPRTLARHLIDHRTVTEARDRETRGAESLFALLSVANCLRVSEVLRPTGRQLRAQQIPPGNKRRPQTASGINWHFYPAVPCSVKLNASDLGQNIDRCGLSSHAKERSLLYKVRRGKSTKRRSELRQGGEQCRSVFGVAPHK